MSSDFCGKYKSSTAQPRISPLALNLMKKAKSIPPASTSSALDMIMKCSEDRQDEREASSCLQKGSF